jgi:hypothetical protein
MQLLASMGTVREVDADKYVPTPYARAMTKTMFKESIKLMYVFGAWGRFEI